MREAYINLCNDLEDAQIRSVDLLKLADLLKIDVINTTKFTKSDLCNLVLKKLTQVEPVREIKPGLFVSSRIVDGERLYFGVQNKPELIEEFKNFTYNIGESQNFYNLSNAIASLAIKCRQLEVSECLKKLPESFWEATNLDTDKKRKDFVMYVYGSGKMKDGKKLYMSMKGITSGASYASKDKVGWVSTQPITDYRDFGYAGNNIDSGEAEVDKLYQSNRDLVMLISIDFGDNVMSVIGIFKTPHEILYGDHRNISLMFHGFLNDVAHALGKEWYHINSPASSMEDILDRLVHKGQPYRGVKIAEQISLTKFPTKEMKKLYTKTQ